MSAILEGLNSEQLAAVKCVEGPVLIVAGAGSGKTRVLTSRIAHILSQGADPSRVMALTFTKKAATEMKERIAAMVGQRNARSLVMGTFHSVFIRFLRDYSDRLGYPKTFTIYDTSDSQSCIKACIKELQLDDKLYKPKDVLGRISMAKNNLYTSGSYKANQAMLQADSAAKKPRICDLFALYEAKCRQAGVMDFDDILLNMNILLRDCPEALEDLARRFDHILVDEYQDTNFAQYIILKRLTKYSRNLCVVGDDSQSIYAFRGAKVENILNFKKDFPECHIFRLERNYRSTQTIVDAANSVIEKNFNRIPKQCYAVGEEGELIQVMRPFTESEEAQMVASDIVSRMQRDKCQYADFAILYRTNSQSRILEEVLRNRNLPYIIYSGNSFFERAEVKDVMAYFKLAVNINDNESFKRIVNTPARGIGDTSINALIRVALAHDCSLFKAVYQPDYEQYGLKPAAQKKILDFCNQVGKWAEAAAGSDALSVARLIIDGSGYLTALKLENSIESLARAGNVDELLNSVSSFVEERQNDMLEDYPVAEGEAGPTIDQLPVVTLGDFLENISLLSNADTEDDENGANRVSLMTVHSSKGLEYPYVYIVGMEENLFPSGGFSALPADVEEERRLFYVAVTRAKKAVAVSFARTRKRNGNNESNKPSRFLKEINQKYLDSPITEEDMANEGVGGWGSATGGRYGGFGASFGSRSGSGSFGSRGSYGQSQPQAKVKYGMSGSYGASSGVRIEKRTAAPARPSAQPLSKPAARPSYSAPAPVDPSFVPSPAAAFRVGQTIEHARFGKGKVVNLDGQGLDIKATVDFFTGDQKVILLRFGKMRIVQE